MINVILDFLELEVSISMCLQMCQNIPNGLKVKFYFFSEFEPRKNFDKSKMPFDYIMGYIMPISMCMQNFITTFLTVQEIETFSLFQNLSSTKPRPMKNVIS